ncbi:nucleoside diphosphate kinase homolog 5-like isoform X2 [Pseudomyrmex gracilis]|uniref:nucleoside diphosphate kinase homolog 5-like isoform X2 n=1 Tax=Pseudomyrmex gracilis TaxID=219809 RepID=UPI000994C3CF|nr:nucleoside diphosphate kinase homolog 5-like isoform X2 [Pseudomyrmex gracilis]
MCDCPEKKDDKTVSKISPETVTIFSKCPKPYRPGKDILDQGPPGTGWLPIDSAHYNSSDTSYDTTKTLSSSESSSDTSKTYNIVCLSKCNCSEEVENGCKSPICHEINRIKDVAEKEPDIELTLAIIKPEATVYRKQIEYEIYTEGFEICQTRWLQLTPEQASEFYNNNFGDMSFPYLIAYMSSKPIIVFVLAKQNAVEEWKRIMGPTTVAQARLYFPDSIRAKYGCKGDSIKNAVHGSNSREEAIKEIHFFFPELLQI